MIIWIWHRITSFLLRGTHDRINEKNFKEESIIFFDVIKLIWFFSIFIWLLYQGILLSCFGGNISFFSFSQTINDSFIFFFIAWIYLIFWFLFKIIVIKKHYNSIFWWLKTIFFSILIILAILWTQIILYNVDTTDILTILAYLIILCILPLGWFIFIFWLISEKSIFTKEGVYEFGFSNIIYLLIFILLIFILHLFSYNNQYSITLKKEEGNEISQTWTLFYKNDKYAIIKHSETDTEYKVLRIDSIETFIKKKNNLGY